MRTTIRVTGWQHYIHVGNGCQWHPGGLSLRDEYGVDLQLEQNLFANEHADLFHECNSICPVIVLGIRGFADGEGGFHKNAVHMANMELPLIQGISKTLSEMGIKCVIQRRARGKYRPIYRIVITDVLNIARYAYHVGFCQQSKQQAVEHYIQHICRKGRQYNLEDYYKYVELSKQGASIRKMSKVLGIHYNAMWKRVTHNIYPLSDKDIEVLKPFQPPSS